MIEMSRSSEVMEGEDHMEEVTEEIEQNRESGMNESDDIENDEITDFERGIILSVPYSCSIGIWFNALIIPIYQISTTSLAPLHIENSV